MADKSSGDSLKCSVKANPLLSSAVIGLSIEDFTHRAVLCPIPATSDAQDATEELRPQNTTLSNPEPQPISASSQNTNTLHFAPVHKPSFPLNPVSPTIIAKSQIDTNLDNKLTETNASDKSKKHDDFDVNEYFARLQGTRYVSAPPNTNLAKEINQNMPVEEESAFSEINLCEDSQGNISNAGEDFQNSITADIAQNFSQLPQVLPQMASAVFSSFSSILNLNKPYKQETVPSAPNYGHPEVNQQFSQNVGQSANFTVDQSIRPPSIEMKPEILVNPVPMLNATDYQGGVNVVSQNKNTDSIGRGLTKPPNNIGSGNQYRLTSKKKTYAPVPSLQYGTQSDKNPVQLPVPNLPTMPPLPQNTATLQSSSLLPNSAQSYPIPEKEPPAFNMFPSTSALSNIFVPSFSETSAIPNVSSTPYGIAASEIPIMVPFASSSISMVDLETDTNLKSMLNIEHDEHRTTDYFAPAAIYSSPNIFVPASVEISAPPLIHQASSPSSTFDSFPESSVPISNERVETNSAAPSECSQTGGLSLAQKIANFKPSFLNPFGSSQPAVPTNLNQNEAYTTQYPVVPPMTKVALSSRTIPPLLSNLPFSGNVETPIFLNPTTYNQNSCSIDKISEAPPIPKHPENNPVPGQPPKNISGNKFRLQNKKRLQYYSGPIDGQAVSTPKAIETPFPRPPQPFSNPLGSISYFSPHTPQKELIQEKRLSQNDTINVVQSIGQNTTPTMFNPYTSQEQNMNTHLVPFSQQQPTQEDSQKSIIFTPTQLAPIDKSDFKQNNVPSVFNPYSNQKREACLTNNQSSIPQTPDNLSSVSLYTPKKQTTQSNESTEKTPSILHPHASQKYKGGYSNMQLTSPEFNETRNITPTQQHSGSISMFTPKELPIVVEDTFQQYNTPSQYNSSGETSNSIINDQLFSSRQLNAELQELNTQGNSTVTSTFTSQESLNLSRDTFEQTLQKQTSITFSSSDEAFQSSTFDLKNVSIEDHRPETQKEKFAESQTSYIINPHPDFKSSEQMVAQNAESEISLKPNTETHQQIQDTSNSTVTFANIPIQNKNNFEANNTYFIANSNSESPSFKQHIIENTQSYDNSSSTFVSSPNYNQTRDNNSSSTLVLSPNYTQTHDNNSSSTLVPSPNYTQTHDNNSSSTLVSSPNYTQTHDNNSSSTLVPSPNYTQTHDNNSSSTLVSSPNYTQTHDNNSSSTLVPSPNYTQTHDNNSSSTLVLSPNYTRTHDNNSSSTLVPSPNYTQTHDNNSSSTSVSSPNYTQTHDNNSSSTLVLSPNYTQTHDNNSSSTLVLSPNYTQTHDNNSSSTLVSSPNHTSLQAGDNFEENFQTLSIPFSDQQSVTNVHSNITFNLDRNEHNFTSTKKHFLNDSSVDPSTVKIKDNVEPNFQEANTDKFDLSPQTEDHFLNTVFEDSFKSVDKKELLENAKDIETPVSEILNDIEREISDPTSDFRDNSIEDMKIGDYMHFGLPQNEEGSHLEVVQPKKFPANASDEFKAEFKNIITRDKIESSENISFKEDDSKEYKNSKDLDEIKKIPITELTQKQFEYLADNAKDSQTFHREYYEKFDVVATTDDDKLVKSDDVEKLEKLNIAESTNIQSSFYKQSISSPVSVGSFTSYFDTGNFAVENYLKNNQSVQPVAPNSSTLSKPDIIESTRNVKTEVSQTADDNLAILPDPLQFFNATNLEAPKENIEENLLAKYFSFPQETLNSSNSTPISSLRQDFITNLATPIHSHTSSPVSETNSISVSSNLERSPIQSFFQS